MKNSPLVILTVFLVVYSLPLKCLSATIDDIINSNKPVTDAEIEDSGEAAPPLPPSDETDSGAYAIQLGLYTEQEPADEQIIELQSAGLDAYVFQTVNSKSQTVYAVRIGRFQTPQDAFDTLAQIKKDISAPAVVTAYDSLEPITSPEEPTLRIASSSERSMTERKMPRESSAAADIEADEIPQSLEERIKSLESQINQLQEEAEVRKKLQMTDEEATEEEEDILEAAGREYTLTDAGNLKFSYGFGYTYNEYDAIRESVKIEDVSNHTIRNSINVSYGLRDNLTLSTGIPFIYKYNRVGTIDEKDVTDLGDLSLNWKYQPIKTNSDLPTIIINGGFDIPVGRSPYEIQPGEELSTSSGFYSTSIGVSVSQTSDPVVVFSSLSASYSLPLDDINQKRNEGVLDEIDPGIGIGIGAGMAYALSYKLNMNMSISYSYSFETEYRYQNAPSAKTGTSASASLRIGTGYRLSRQQNLNFGFGIPITSSGSFSFSFSTPIEFEL